MTYIFNQILNFVKCLFLIIIKFILSLFHPNPKTIVNSASVKQTSTKKEEIKKINKAEIIIPNTPKAKEIFIITKEDIKKTLEIILKEDKNIFIENKEEFLIKLNKEIFKQNNEGLINNKDDLKKEIKEIIIKEKKLNSKLQGEEKAKEFPKKEEKEEPKQQILKTQEEKKVFINKKEDIKIFSPQFIFIKEPNPIIEEKQELIKIQNHFLEKDLKIDNIDKELYKKIINDDCLYNKDYEKIEKYIDNNINMLTKETSLKELKQTKQAVEELKDEELENVRKDTEEEITIKEKESFLLELDKIKKEEEEHAKLLELDKQEEKINIYLESYKEQLIKKEMNSILNKLSFPFILTFPFIKNKYFKMFVGSFFLYNQINFVRRLVTGKRKEEELDLTVINTGLDALNGYGNNLRECKENFLKLKEEILLKYPNLMFDEEFVKKMKKTEKLLNAKEKKYLSDKERINKYFYKGKYMERKLKRKIV